MNSKKTLRELVLDEFPPAFVQALQARIGGIYSQGYKEVMSNPAYGDAEAKYVLGYDRRGRAETVLRVTAIEHGLKVTDVQPDVGGVQHVAVRIGRFHLEICHVGTNAAFPKKSDTRVQSSMINGCLSQGDMFPENISVDDDKPLYCIAVHTQAHGNKREFGSMYIGFPRSDGHDWVEEPLNVKDIIDMQAKRFQKVEDPHADVQKAEPVWRTNIEKTNSEGKDK